MVNVEVPEEVVFPCWEMSEIWMFRGTCADLVEGVVLGVNDCEGAAIILVKVDRISWWEAGVFHRCEEGSGEGAAVGSVDRERSIGSSGGLENGVAMCMVQDWVVAISIRGWDRPFPEWRA